MSDRELIIWFIRLLVRMLSCLPCNTVSLSGRQLASVAETANAVCRDISVPIESDRQ